MLLNIRQATPDDLETLYSIERECFTLEAFTKEQLADLLENPKGISLIAQIDNEIVGFIVGLIYDRDTTRRGHVCTIDVAIKYRRRGVGLRLLEELERVFLKRGVKICYLEARLDNVAALDLYRKHGFVEAGTLRDHYSLGTHGVQLVKRLS